MKILFNSLPWHDSELIYLNINREKPGSNDVVTMKINWSEGDELKSSSVIFYDCYFLELKMNFGIKAEETIISAECLEDSKQIENIKSSWEILGVDLSNLKCYQFKTNSTNSLIKIYSLGFFIETL